jgi:hypothetical protein
MAAEALLVNAITETSSAEKNLLIKPLKNELDIE